MNWNPDIGIPLAIAGVLFLIALTFFGRPRKPDQGRRREAAKTSRPDVARREPHFGDDPQSDEEAAHEPMDGSEDTIQDELDLIDQSLAGESGFAVDSTQGRRSEDVPQRIVTLFVAARDGETIDGAAIVVAAEKAGLVYGHMGIFHRLVDGQMDAEPVFSVASMVKPGSFDLRHVHDIQTPGLTFFMTLPGPVPALDAWEMMLPTAQRMAELLGVLVLDEQRNALGRQGIAHIRDDLRNFDREQEKEAKRRW